MLDDPAFLLVVGGGLSRGALASFEVSGLVKVMAVSRLHFWVQSSQVAFPVAVASVGAGPQVPRPKMPWCPRRTLGGASS